VRWITSYNITIDDVKDRGSYWKLEASLGFDFLTSGSLGLVIQDITLDTDLRCVTEGNCTTGEHIRINEHVLKAILEPGFFKQLTGAEFQLQAPTHSGSMKELAKSLTSPTVHLSR
jgi:hypothetical protein